MRGVVPPLTGLIDGGQGLLEPARAVPDDRRVDRRRIPPGSVVVSGNLPAPDGRYSLYCAVIIKQVDAKTRAKTGINELLRGD